MPQAKRALIVIDVQNDYFAGGKFPLWNTAETLARIVTAIERANAQGVPVILVQHVSAAGAAAPIFGAGTPGAQIHAHVLAAAPSAPIVNKAYADAFHETSLEATLQQLGVEELLVCGMMTQNCVTHTAISRRADTYRVTILSDCCTTVSAEIHAFALRAVETRLRVVETDAVLGSTGASQ